MAFATLEEARKHLRLAGANTTTDDDAKLTQFLGGAEEQLTSRVGPLEPTEVTEKVRANGTGTLVLTETPIISLTSLEPILLGMATVPVGLLDVDERSGVVERVDCLPLCGRWKVTYQAGFATLPTTVKVAGLDLVLHWWRQSQSHGSTTYGEGSVVDFSDLPNAVLNKLRPYLRLPGG